MTADRLVELEEQVRTALSIGFVSWDGDDWYASKNNLGPDGHDYDAAEQAFRDASAALQALLEAARERDRLREALVRLMDAQRVLPAMNHDDAREIAAALGQARAILSEKEGSR